MSQIQAILFRVTAAVIAVSLLQAIPLKRSVRRVIGTACGAVLLLLLLEPLLRLRAVDPEDYLKRFRLDEGLIDEAVQDGQTQAGALIKEQTCAYILDKAAALGAQVRAEVTLAALSEHYQYPYAVTVAGRWTAAQQRELSDYISHTLGIPPERQTWRKEAS